MVCVSVHKPFTLVFVAVPKLFTLSPKPLTLDAGVPENVLKHAAQAWHRAVLLLRLLLLLLVLLVLLVLLLLLLLGIMKRNGDES